MDEYAGPGSRANMAFTEEGAKVSRKTQGQEDRAVNGIQAQLERLREQLKSAHNVLDTLSNRIAPILEYDGGSPEADTMKAVESPRSELSSQILDIQSATSALIERLHNIHDRVVL